MSDIGEFLISTFPNYTKEMYDGNEPAGKGHELVCGGFADRWETKYGGGETFNGKIIHFSFSLNPKVTIDIVGDVLNIHDIRHSSKNDVWVFCNKRGYEIAGTFNQNLIHQLEPDRVEKYLNSSFPNCKIWDIVQARAKQLYKGSTK